MDIIKEDIFRKEIKKGLSGGYLFFGEEDYMKSFCLRLARESICTEETFAVFNDVRISPLDYTPSVLLNALMPPPMMADKKIITIDGLALFDMKSPDTDEFYEVLSTLSEYDYNVLIISVPYSSAEESASKKKLLSLLSEPSKYLTPVQFDSIAPARLSSWLAKHFEHHGVTASPSVCNLIIERCGRSMFVLSSESEKLSYYVLSHGRKDITAQDVDNICTTAISSDAFALTNAITDGKYAEAIDALRIMKFHKVDPTIILAEVSRTLCDLLCIKCMQEQGATIPEMMKATGQKNDFVTKAYARAATKKSKEKLRRAIILCSEADTMLKESSQTYEPIERLICHL